MHWRSTGRICGSIAGMKLSVSLPGDDVAFLDSYADAHAMASRSAVVQQAIGALRREQLPDAYRQAWEEWGVSEDAVIWNETVGDGL